MSTSKSPKADFSRSYSKQLTIFHSQVPNFDACSLESFGQSRENVDICGDDDTKIHNDASPSVENEGNCFTSFRDWHRLGYFSKSHRNPVTTQRAFGSREVLLIAGFIFKGKLKKRSQRSDNCFNESSDKIMNEKHFSFLT